MQELADPSQSLLGILAGLDEAQAHGPFEFVDARLFLDQGDEPGRFDTGVSAKVQAAALGVRIDVRDTQALGVLA